MPHQVRGLLSEPLSKSELKTLSRRVGGAVNLVGPMKRDQIEGMAENQIIDFLLEDPGRIRRPIIDTGSEVLLGFTAPVRQKLEHE